MNILYFGIYDPEYGRNRVIRKALATQGMVINHCYVQRGWFWRIKLLWKYFRTRPQFDVMLVGFPVQEVMLFASWITRKPIVADVFTSHYQGYVIDRQKVKPNSLRARWYRFLDRRAVQKSDATLLDTQEHIDYFVNEFGVDRAKLHRVWVGTDTDVFKPQKDKKENETFIVHFHGSFIPLQGVEYIVKAAVMLKDMPIQFRIVGRGQTYPGVRALAQSLNASNITFYEPMSYARLATMMAEADICLGIFGDTQKANMVIPNKIYEATAMEKPVITADTPAIKELFSAHDLMLIPLGDALSLSRAIKELYQGVTMRNLFAQYGHKTFMAHATQEHIGQQLKNVLQNVHGQ